MRAANEKRRPPFTTLATRLTLPTARSSNWESAMETSFSSLELETRVAGRVGDRSDAAVIEEPAAVEHDLGDTGGLGPVGHEGTDLRGRLDIAGGAALEVLLDGGRGRDGAAVEVVDDLGGDVLVRAEHRQAGPLGGAGDELAHPVVPPRPRQLLVLGGVTHFALTR